MVNSRPLIQIEVASLIVSKNMARHYELDLRVSQVLGWATERDGHPYIGARDESPGVLRIRDGACFRLELSLIERP